MASTANAIIARSLKLLGVVASGESATADEATDAFDALNDLVASWATERLTIYVTARTSYTLVASTATYTIGSGGTFNQARPLWIPYAGVIESGGTSEYPVEVLNLSQWAAIAIKTQTSTFPTKIYYDNAFTSSRGTINVWPVPTTTPALILYTPTALVVFADRTTSYNFPPGYERALRYNLAVELAPEYGVPLDGVIAAIAAESKGNIKRANIEPYDARVDAALLGSGGRFNWRTGDR